MPNHRKPTQILDLTGRLAHDRKRYEDRANEPRDNAPLGDPPEWLPATEREIWEQVAAQLVAGVALASDRSAFESMVRLIAKERRDGELSGPEGSRLSRLFAGFGMTPADRSRVSVPPRAAANAFDDDEEEKAG